MPKRLPLPAGVQAPAIRYKLIGLKTVEMDKSWRKRVEISLASYETSELQKALRSKNPRKSQLISLAITSLENWVPLDLNPRLVHYEHFTGPCEYPEKKIILFSQRTIDYISYMDGALSFTISQFPGGRNTYFLGDIVTRFPYKISDLKTFTTKQLLFLFDRYSKTELISKKDMSKKSRSQIITILFKIHNGRILGSLERFGEKELKEPLFESLSDERAEYYRERVSGPMWFMEPVRPSFGMLRRPLYEPEKIESVLRGTFKPPGFYWVDEREIVYPIKLLMKTRGISDDILEMFGLDRRGFSFEEQVQLIWLVLYTGKRTNCLEEISHLSVEEMLLLFPDDYDGPKDRVTLLWALIGESWLDNEDICQTDAYLELLKVEPEVVYDWAVRLYGWQSDNCPSFLSPYRFIAKIGEMRKPKLEMLIRANKLYGFDAVQPHLSTFMVVIYELQFLRKVKSFEACLNREGPPGDIFSYKNEDVSVIRDLFFMHTDLEIRELGFYSRSNALEQLELIAGDGPDRWFSFGSIAYSENPVSQITLVERENEENDPVVYYGRFGNYISVNLSELDSAFGGEEKILRNPAYRKVEEEKEETHLFRISQFPIETIGELNEVIETIDPHDRWNCLRHSIENCVREARSIDRYIRDVQRDFRNLEVADHNLMYKVIFQIFLISMYARFWKGPGHPYPHRWVDGGGFGGLGTPQERNDNYTREGILLRDVVNQLSENGKRFFSKLKIVKYIWRDDEAYVTGYTFEELFEDSANGRMCLADLSDRCLRTSYHFLSKILEYDDPYINEMINDYIECPVQEPFEPNRVGFTGHNDPEHENRVWI